MTEEEKMLAGEIYDANYNKDLIEKRIIAKELCKKYNELHVRDIIGKKEVIEKLLQKEVKQFTIEPNFFCDYGFNIRFWRKLLFKSQLSYIRC